MREEGEREGRRGVKEGKGEDEWEGKEGRGRNERRRKRKQRECMVSQAISLKCTKSMCCTFSIGRRILHCMCIEKLLSGFLTLCVCVCVCVCN